MKMIPGQRRGYSGKVKALGYGIIALEIVTVLVLILAFYSMAITGSSIASSIYTNFSNGKGFALKNSTVNGQVQEAFVLPSISNRGYFPVTLSINAAYLDARNQQIGTALVESLTVGAGQTRDFVIPFSGARASDANGIHFTFQISSVFGLIGMSTTATVTK